MKKYLFFIFCLQFFNLSAQKGNINYSVWNSGSTDETYISADKFVCNDKGKLCYFLSNDRENLTVDMIIKDGNVQGRILKEGMIIWINTDGKQARKMGVRFPVGSQRQSGRNNRMNLPATNPDGSIITPLSMANTIELIGFENEPERRFSADNADNFRGFVKYDNEGILHYRMLMPIAMLPVRNSKEAGGVMPISFGIEYGALPSMAEGQRPAGPPSSSGVPSGGGSRGGSRPGRGGGMPGGSGPAGGASASTNPPVIVWIKNITLATDK